MFVWFLTEAAVLQRIKGSGQVLDQVWNRSQLTVSYFDFSSENDFFFTFSLSEDGPPLHLHGAPVVGPGMGFLPTP